MDQIIFAPLSHTHYWYEVGMLKVPAEDDEPNRGWGGYAARLFSVLFPFPCSADHKKSGIGYRVKNTIFPAQTINTLSVRIIMDILMGSGQLLRRTSKTAFTNHK